MFEAWRARLAAAIAPSSVGASASNFGQKTGATAPALAARDLEEFYADAALDEEPVDEPRRIKTMQEVEAARDRRIFELTRELAQLNPAERSRVIAQAEPRRVGPRAIRERYLSEHARDKADE